MSNIKYAVTIHAAVTTDDLTAREAVICSRAFTAYCQEIEAWRDNEVIFSFQLDVGEDIVDYAEAMEQDLATEAPFEGDDIHRDVSRDIIAGRNANLRVPPPKPNRIATKPHPPPPPLFSPHPKHLPGPPGGRPPHPRLPRGGGAGPQRERQ